MGRGAEGIMIARKLGKDPKLRDLPVLIITGIREQMAFLFPGQAVHPHFVAVDELVEKPVAPKLLLEKVAGAAEDRRSAKGQEQMNAAAAETTTANTTAPPDNGISFVEEIGNLLYASKGNPINTCIQCGTCSATCPVASGGFMDNSPRRIIALIRSGFKEQVLKANTYWYCASCYQCTVRCPRGIDIAELMYGLKRYTVWKTQTQEGLIGPVFSETFVKMILRSGRSYEPVLATTYLFTYGLPEMIQEAQTATAADAQGPAAAAAGPDQAAGQLQAHDQAHHPIGRQGMKTYAYFPGCSLEKMAHSYHASALETSRALGVELQELEDWNCCGATAYFHVDELLAYTLCARNLAMAEKAEAAPRGPVQRVLQEHVLHAGPPAARRGPGRAHQRGAGRGQPQVLRRLRGASPDRGVRQ